MARYIDAVSRTEITDELNRLGRNAFKDDTDYDNFFAFLDSLPSVTPTRKKERWIPCSERLPKPQNDGDKDFSDWVQITINIGHPEPKDPYVTEGYYCFSEQKWYTKRFVIGVVTAWMPLPEPYKESEGQAN